MAKGGGAGAEIQTAGVPSGTSENVLILLFQGGRFKSGITGQDTWDCAENGYRHSALIVDVSVENNVRVFLLCSCPNKPLRADPSTVTNELSLHSKC